MPSAFEDLLLRKEKKDEKLQRGAGTRNCLRRHFFAVLDDASLRTLRLVSRPCRDLADHHPGRLFRQIYIKTPLEDNDNVVKLKAFVPFCYDLTVTLKQDVTAKRRSVASFVSGLSTGGLPGKAKRFSSRLPWYKKRASAFEATEQTFGARTSITPGHVFIEKRAIQLLALEGWKDTFSRCHQLRTLTVRIPGDPAWPGRTELEDTLVTIRAALETSNIPTLREVRFTPVHAMGIIHLRWAGLSTFGPQHDLPKAPQRIVWQQIRTLEIQMLNPFTRDRLTIAQDLMFRKLLYDYLRSFSPTLQSLRFIWLDGEGPSPLTLEMGEPLRGEREPLVWHNLTELRLGNATLPNQSIRVISRLTPKLEKLYMLRSTHHDKPANPDAWMEVWFSKPRPNSAETLVATMVEEAAGDYDDEHADAASSVYSRSTTSSVHDLPGNVSRASRVVPFKLVLQDSEDASALSAWQKRMSRRVDAELEAREKQSLRTELEI